MYKVHTTFVAWEAISGRERRFEPGVLILCDMGQTGSTVVIEADTILFLVDRFIFETHTKFFNQGGSAF
jgi:hypothetical protein